MAQQYGHYLGWPAIKSTCETLTSATKALVERDLADSHARLKPEPTYHRSAEPAPSTAWSQRTTAAIPAAPSVRAGLGDFEQLAG